MKLQITTTTAFLLFILTGQSSAVHTLVCPDKSNMTRVWCKRDAQKHKCCSGFAFSPGVSVLEDGNVRVREDGSAFTVSMETLTQGDGVYWCGLRKGDGVVVKLAEDYFTSTPFDPVWLFLRWILFLMLLLATVSSVIYSNKMNQKKASITLSNVRSKNMAED